MTLAVAASAALTTALCYAVASVLQQNSAVQAPRGTGLHINLLRHLLRQPRWLAGQGASVAGACTHALALASGPLVIVQPLLLLGLVFALPASLLIQHHQPSMRQVLWALTLVGSLAGILIAAHPGGGTPDPDMTRLLTITALTLLTVAMLTAIAIGPLRAHRAGLLGAATGATHGLAAALLKGTLADAQHGVWVLLGGWLLWLFLFVGLTGLVLNLAAFQAGPLTASLPLLTIADTLVAVGIGVSAFNETVRTSPSALLVQFSGAVLIIACVAALTPRLDDHDESPT